MRNREQYQDFLKCLSLFSEDIISKQELINLMMDSLSRHPDLQVSHICMLHQVTTAAGLCSSSLMTQGGDAPTSHHTISALKLP